MLGFRLNMFETSNILLKVVNNFEKKLYILRVVLYRQMKAELQVPMNTELNLHE